MHKLKYDKQRSYDKGDHIMDTRWPQHWFCLCGQRHRNLLCIDVDQVGRMKKECVKNDAIIR